MHGGNTGDTRRNAEDAKIISSGKAYLATTNGYPLQTNLYWLFSMPSIALRPSVSKRAPGRRQKKKQKTGVKK
jgi:hypothetical protein